MEEGDVVGVSLPLEKKFKQFEEFPNDPQRGHDYLSSLYYLEEEEGVVGLSGLEQSNALLVFINEPDFSMPFNVIAVSSAVIAYLLISVFNLTMSA